MQSPKPEFWQQFHHTSIRDLAWLLTSPAMFDGILGPYRDLAPTFDQTALSVWLREQEQHLDRNPSYCADILRANHRRLGLYAEALLRFYWQHGARDGVSREKLLAHNLQLKHKQQTIGECDFILKSDDDTYIHTELAVKFYLRKKRHDNQWASWVGPNTIDRLDLKLDRMLSHQLHLLQRKDILEEINVLKNELCIPNPTESEVCTANKIEPRHLIKGFLFNHHECRENSFAKEANPNGLRGHWMHLNEFKVFNETHGNSGFLCDKMAWFTGPSLDEAPLTSEQLIAAVYELYQRAEKKFKAAPPVMIRFVEKINQPMMVVPDHWPEINSPLRSM